AVAGTHEDMWGDDGFWTHSQGPDWGNGGVDAAGSLGGNSFYADDADPPMLTTTATGLDTASTYNVYLAYYSKGAGVQAALSGQTLETYLGNHTIDTGFDVAGVGDDPSVKLALLGQVSGVSELAIDVDGTGAGATWYEGLLLESIVNLTWDESVGNWPDAPGGNSHWEGGAADQIPSLFDPVEIHAGTATVTAPGGEANILTATGGGVVIDTGQTLTIADSIDLQSGSSMTLRGGATLAVGDGGGTIAQMNIGGAAPADVTVSTAGDLQIGAFDNKGVDGTFTKSGSGVLSMSNVPAGGVSAAGTTFKVAEGTLSMLGTDPLGGSSSVELAGGTLQCLLAVSAEGILADLAAGSIYADAMYGAEGSTVNSDTNSVDDYIKDPAVSGTHEDMWGDDGFWTHNNADPWGNGGIDAAGVPGGSSLYADDADPPMLTTTATGLDPAETYNVYLAYYSKGGVQAALSGEALETYLDNYTVDTGVVVPGMNDDPSVKLALLGQVNGVSEVAIDVDSTGTGSTWYEGLVAELTGGGAGAFDLDLKTTAVSVTNSSTIETAAERLDFGPLTLAGGVLVTGGASDRITFTETTVQTGAVDVGFDTGSNTVPGPITANGATIIKRGAADLILDDATGNVEDATFDVQAGRLVGYHGPNPIEGATVRLAGGDLLLSAKAEAVSPVTYDNAVTVDTASSISAGAGTSGTSGVEVILGGANGLKINAPVSLSSTDDYTLNVAGAVDGPGQEATVTGGQVALSGGGTLGTLTVDAGALSTAGNDLAVDRLVLADGVTAGTGASNHVTVGERFRVGSMASFRIIDGGPIQVSGESLGDAMNVVLSGGTVQIDGGVGAVPVVPTAGLVAQWRFEDPDDLGYDSASPDRAYTAVGGPTQELDGKLGGALRIDNDGSDSRLELDNTGLTGVYSISGWLNLDDPVQAWASALWGQWQGGGQYWAGFGTDHGDGETPNFADWSGYADGSQNWYVTSAQPADGPIEPGRWYHVVSVRDGVKAELWVDGQKVAEMDAGPAFEPAGPVVIGNANPLGNDYDGLIDELYVYNRGLSGEEIATLNDPEIKSGAMALSQASLVVTADTEITSDSVSVALGDLTITNPSQPAGPTTLTLSGAVYAFNNATVADGVTVDGEWEVGGTLEVASGIGELILGDGELVMAPSSVSNVLVSVAAKSGEADKISLSSGGSLLMLGGELKVSSANDRVSNAFWADASRLVIDNPVEAGGAIGWMDTSDPANPVMRSNRFDTVNPALPAPGEPGMHIGHGAFLENVVYDGLWGDMTNTVNLDLFIALGGDADGDGKVWLSDWAALRANFGNTGAGKTWTEGNFDPW
ncbi:MAG: LamG domain-containing protein, partial [Candidatus Nealsonbacteria bacterium]|nr:LamG domain-containing protein [Candidatus Nealsonbacteria bacterium]